MMKLMSVFLIVILFIQAFVEASSVGDAVNSIAQEDVGRHSGGLLTSKMDCGSACKVRCSKSSRMRFCFRACASCCRFCGCVPPGTYGNLNFCPCYAKQKTHGNKRKCP